MPIVSIVIATRNRAQKLERLLSCVKQQVFTDFECIVVDDASSEETQAQYDSIWKKLDARFVLKFREFPGGPAQGRNTGILASRGRYVAFCDDDDYWTRADHLEVAVRTLDAENADFFFANMQTSIDNEIHNADWFQVLTGLIAQPVSGETDVYAVGKKELAVFLKHRIHHANTMVVEHELLMQVNAYWDKVVFAEDHDLSFRLSDKAKRVIFRKTVTADLDVSPHPSVARTFTEKDRLLFSMLATLHAEANMEDAALRRVARGNRAWRLIELAQHCLQDGHMSMARSFAWQSLLLFLSFTAIRMIVQSCLRRRSAQGKEKFDT